MPLSEFISFPAETGLIHVLQSARDTLFVATPYLKDYGVQVVLKYAICRRLQVLTNLDVTNIISRSFDLAALLKLWDKFDVQVSSLGKLHAKVYVADHRVAFITSANLTRGGLRQNYEYGILMRDEPAISAMLEDMSAYFNLGNLFDRATLENLRPDVEELQALHQEAETSPEARLLQRALRQKGETLQTKFLKNRVQNKTVNAIFAETIVYLLRNKGPLSTQELHPLIQDIHPDICDDTIDRVINGQHFGKKWKHLVRNAQQYLRRSGAIDLESGRWHLLGLAR